ncbi:hypothetical protein EDB85DRAFT_2298559 [Lactarius pseudohatsudake]|nr:hypothetical protein EDB85DRAFT_2298559 [Lactarius pseudohatsudake]
MAAAQHLEHGQISSDSRRPSPSRNPGRGCVNPLSSLPILGQELPLDSPRDAEPQEGPSQFRVDVTVLRAENVPRLKNIFGPKFFVIVTGQAIEKKTPSVPAKRRTARWGESLGAFILQPSTPLILRLYAERFARRDILIGAGEMIPVESQIDTSFVLTNGDGQGGESVTLYLTVIVSPSTTSGTILPINAPIVQSSTINDSYSGEAGASVTQESMTPTRSAITTGSETLSPPTGRLPSEMNTIPPASDRRGLSPVESALDGAGEATATMNLSNKWEGAVGRIKWVMDTVSPVAELHPYAKMAFNLLFAIPKTLLEQFQRDDNIGTLLDAMRDAFDFANQEDRFKAIGRDSRQAQILTLMLQHVCNCCDFIRSYAKDSQLWKRILKNTGGQIDKTIEDFRATLLEHRKAFLDEASITTEITALQILDDVGIISADVGRISSQLDGMSTQLKWVSSQVSDAELDAKIREIPYGTGSRFTPDKGCLTGTRPAFLDFIVNWVNDPGSGRCLVLFGQAGTGKSSIAHEIARRFDKIHRLTSSFIFLRTEQSKPHHLFTTLARDLSDRYPSFKAALGSVVKDNSSLRAGTHLSSRVDKYFPPALHYACRFWDDHMEHIGFEIDLFGKLGSLFEQKLLFWLEALSLTSDMRLASAACLAAKVWLASDQVGKQGVSRAKLEKLRSLVNDASVFIRHFGMAMAKSAPHVYVSALPFAPSGSPVSAGYSSSFPRILRVERGRISHWPSSEMVIPSSGGQILSISISSDGQRIVTGSDDRTIRVWDANTGETEAGPFTGHTSSVNSVAFSPDGQRIVSGSHDRTIRVWNASTGEMEAGPFTGHTDWVNSVAFSPDGQRIVSGSHDGTIRVWNASTGETEAGPFTGHTNSVKSVAFSPDGQRIVSGSNDGTIRVWNASTGETEAGPFTGHTDWVKSVAFSPDGQRIVSGSRDGTIRVWNASTGETEAGPFTGHTHSVNSVAFSPDGQRIVSGSDDGTICVWNASTGETEAGPFTGHTSSVNSVAFSPDGQRIVSGLHDGTIRVWNASMGETEAGPFTGHTHWVNSVAFSPDGQRIVSGSDDRTIRVWNAGTGETEAGPFTGHTHSVKSVAFSPDGQQIVSGSSDRTIRVWNASTGETDAGPFTGHTEWIFSVAFSPDGHRIVSGSSDGTIRMLNATTESTETKSHVDFTNHSVINDEGWICGIKGELLMWIPQVHRTGLHRPGNMWVAGKYETRLDLSTFVHGKSWTTCINT